METTSFQSIRILAKQLLMVSIQSDRSMHRIVVCPTFRRQIQISWTRTPICTLLSATKLARNHRAAVVSCSSATAVFFENIDYLILIAAAVNQKLISVSQHSSISQADDCSSPYARVRSPAHAYDKVRPAEHPYAQVKASDAAAGAIDGPSTSAMASEQRNTLEDESQSRRGSQQSLIDSVDGRHSTIPAASAIAGHVSASQELPYMTPPIVQPQQFFSGDSQDSSSKKPRILNVLNQFIQLCWSFQKDTPASVFVSHWPISLLKRKSKMLKRGVER